MVYTNDMKKSRKIAEPTLHNVIEVVQESSLRIEKRLDKVERRLDGVEHRLGGVETRMSEVEDTNRHIIRRVGEMEDKIDEMKDTLDGVDRAVDHDAVLVIQHEQRISRLEKIRS
jgi:chromosome condensin MukBEF ATPase and DNA-binding subunit MukB